MSKAGNSILNIKDRVLIQIKYNRLHHALSLIENTVKFIFSEPLCVSQVLHSEILDDLCLKIGQQNLKMIHHDSMRCSLVKSDVLIYVYVVSKLQRSGGHSQIIKNFINARPQGLHIILSTELAGSSDSNSLKNGLKEDCQVVFEKTPRGDLQKRLTWLQEKLLNIRAEKVYLFNHHQDSVAIAAMQPEMQLDVCFYHHGDHHLCLGAHLEHVEHIDFHPMGYHFCRNEAGIDNRYIPLSIADRGARPSGWSFCENGLITTCTAGRSNKIELPYFVSYLDMVPRILDATGGRHLHIGRLSPWALFKIRRGLKRRGISEERFIYTPWVSSVWRTLHEYRVDLYIASFPYGGGLTLIEAMGAGVPVALHRHIFSRVLSSIEIGYFGAFSWRQPRELIEYCSSITPEKLQSDSILSRKHYEQHHTGKDLRSMLEGDRAMEKAPGDLSDKFYIQRDEWALWMVNQVTLKAVLMKSLYRLFKRIRSYF